MALIVQKFGGSSVGDLQRIENVAEIVTNTRRQGHDVVVVVSAMQGETDRLVGLAKSITKKPNPREYDALISTGEQVSASLLSLMLQKLGMPARSYNAAQVCIRTDSHFGKANILNIETSALKRDLSAGIIPIITGFQGVDDHGNITTLGRGGSDMSGVAIAAALHADECQIYTDVEGVYTTDPRVVSEARLLPTVTFDEMLELSSLGAKVLQIRSVEFANKHNVPLRVLSTFHSGPGTLIKFSMDDSDKPQVSGIALDRNQAKLSILGLPQALNPSEQILRALSEAKIDVDMLVQNIPMQNQEIDFSFTVHSEDYLRTLELMQDMGKRLQAKDIYGNDAIAKLSLVGSGMRSHAGVAAKMLHTLSEKGIQIHLITSSEIKISVVVDEVHLDLGAQLLHSVFQLHKDTQLYIS
jgi:aspartate kinase